MKKILLSLLVSLIVISLVVAGGAVMWGKNVLQQPLLASSPAAAIDGPRLIEIKPGSHTRSVLRQLVEEGVAIDPQWDYWPLRLATDSGRIQAGVYQLTEELTLQGFFERLAAGEQHLFSLTLVEGRTLAEWREQLASHMYLRHDTTHLSDAELYQAIAPEQPWPALEGALYPDTYHFKAHTSELTILQTSFNKMQEELNDAWANRDRDLPYQTPYEMLVMASIIEKETGQRSERGLVSSVFVNRLRKGMRLQSDPTTIYGVTNFDGNLTRAHLREETAYNTYRINGLPPTPIAMPGRESLIAAAQPETSDYFYFVANGAGEHIFSRTLSEHNKAVNRYQRNQTN